MKTGLSLPDGLFEQAEQLAAAQGITRSELYRRAIEKYLADERDRRLSEKVTRFVGEHGRRAEEETKAMWKHVQRVWHETMGDDEW